MHLIFLLLSPVSFIYIYCSVLLSYLFMIPVLCSVDEKRIDFHDVLIIYE